MTDLEEEWHNWGQLAFVHSGLMELSIEGQSVIAPPGFGVWIPPLARHHSYNHQPLDFGTLNLSTQPLHLSHLWLTLGKFRTARYALR